jgi:malonate-semialdehyde dehydrogenase (acetylating)/methylmalonate-semialdehyde dehydrogenase
MDTRIITVGHLIGGQQRPAAGRSQEVFDPACGAVTRHVAMADRGTVDEAVRAALAAFPAWRETPPLKRARVMFRLKELIEAHAERICALITSEHGKVLSDAQGELQRGVENIEFACCAPQLLKGEHSKNVGPAVDSWSELQPLGVAAGITPFNFPAMVPLWMWPLAVACGNTFVLKPSEKTPSAALLIAELAHEAGLPAGVLNVVNGDREAVDALIEHDAVQAISFVGSTPVAQAIYARGCAQGKRVQALGGAKNHAVVMPDADLDNAVSALMGAAYGSCGERCMAVPVVVAVGDETGERLAPRLAAAVRELKVGPGIEPGVEMGPLVTRAHCDRVREYVAIGEREGARLLVDGRAFAPAGAARNGFFLGGCLFDHVTPQMAIYRDEIFGPVLAIVRAATLEEAMALIDGHEFGNGTCIFTRDGEAARWFTDRIKVGMVGVNVPLPVPVAYHSFGGWKRSLFGDLGAYGPDGVRFYTRRKTITQRWPSSGARERAAFHFPSTR